MTAAEWWELARSLLLVVGTGCLVAALGLLWGVLAAIGVVLWATGLQARR